MGDMETQYVLLGFLEQEPNYGYELKKIYDKFFAKQKPVLSGQIYATLARLKRDGKVKEMKMLTAAKAQEPSGGPERIKYQITQLGLTRFEEWLEMPEAPAETLQITLYIKTVLALIRNGDAAGFLNKQRHAHIERMRELTRKRNQVALKNKMLIDYAIFHMEADLRWIDMTESRLLSLGKEIKNELN